MDQAAKKVTISQAIQREFGLQQWESIAKKLEGWSDSVNSLLTVMQNSQ
jgi:eIF3 subunit M, C-terminal helix